jgi:hypothetical protein
MRAGITHMKQPFWIFGILRSRFRDVHYFLAQNVFSDYLEETFFGDRSKAGKDVVK